MSKLSAAKIIILLPLVLFSCTTFAESWSAVARHGECMSFEQLSERSDLFANVVSLDDLKSNIELQGLEYALEPMSPELKDYFNLNIPSEGMAMIITTNKNCRDLAK
ncbi:MAG: hypothetical protein OQL16_10125 [Gammaproteobacteria bacterium]|nr:hypothetical protein [Gammaproteobacteria bacterium]